MNKQKLIDELTTEIDRLSKARNLLKGAGGNPDAGADSLNEKLVAVLKDGPRRRGEITDLLGWSYSHLNEVILHTRNIRTYGKGWVALVDNEKTS